MACYYNEKFEAVKCLPRYNLSIADSEECSYPMCKDCNAVKGYISYRKREIARKDKEFHEHEPKGKGFVLPHRNPQGSNKVDRYMLDRFMKVFEIVKRNSIKSYDELLNFVKYKSLESTYIFIRDNRKGLEILFEKNPIVEE